MPNQGIVIGGKFVNVKNKRGFLILCSVFLLLIGIYIYLLYRPTNLYMFKVFEVTDSFWIIENLRQCDYFPPKQSLPEWVIYNLPDGLWLLSYMIVMEVIWGDGDNIKKLLFVFGMPIIILAWEILQLFHVAAGTWDVRDMLSYLVAIIIFLLYKLFHCITKNPKNYEKNF